jgi:hypothetical protein
MPDHDAGGREAMKESKFYQEIMEEGEINADRKAVLRALEVRFGRGPARRSKKHCNRSTVLRNSMT